MNSLDRCLKDVEYKLPINTFEKEGYKFVGWNTAYDGSGQSFPDGGTVKNLATCDYQHVYLFAQWELERYSISYNLDGGEMPDGYISEYTIKTYTFDLPTPIKEGYRFKGWYAEPDYSGNNVYKVRKGSTGDMVLYAKWKK